MQSNTKTMSSKGLSVFLLLVLCIAYGPRRGGASGTGETIKLGHIELSPNAIENAIDLKVQSIGYTYALTGLLGMSLPKAVRWASPGDCDPREANASSCTQFGDFAQLYSTGPKESNDFCYTLEWRSKYARRLEDCFFMADGVYWYGGGGPSYTDTWPLSGSRPEAPMVPGDSLGGWEYGGVTENYWLTSCGVAIHVDEDTPLWFNMNTTKQNWACLVAQDTYPYKSRDELRLKYHICVGETGETMKDVHLRSLAKFYDRPSTIPDERMMIQPFWSTWAQWHTDVNQTLVQELAARIVAEGFQESSHIEIDDDWESCYGEAEFNFEKFPNPKEMVDSVKALGLRLTIWIHPFINIDCPSFQTALDRGYFVKDPKSNFGMASWWQGSNAGLIDFTNDEAVEWWSSRLERLRTVYGIDSFKFDGGDMSGLPYSHQLTGDVNLGPSIATTKYVEAVARFGKMVEVRVGRRNQKEVIFTRMLDKYSGWGYDNGLQSVIPTLLHFGLKGYPFIMPDMVGGNAYEECPNRELYIRWLQASAFMPSLQLSILPWNYDDEVVRIVKSILDIRNKYADKIIEAAKQSTMDGSPINRPMWWAYPYESMSFTIDDQYMVGNDIVVAPVLKEGATSRTIYLPSGHWKATRNGTVIVRCFGYVTDFPAPLETLPFFVRDRYCEINDCDCY